MVDARKIEDAVREIAKRRFPDGTIVSITAKPRTDSDGDHIWAVTVVVENSKAGRLDAKLASSFARHIRSKLATMGDSSFPLLSFISKSEAARVKPEAA